MANAGIRIFNDQSSYIIDGQYTNPSMVRKGVGTFARESTASEDVVGKVYVQLAAGEVLAFSSQVYCGIAGYDGQFAIIATENPNIGRTVEWYVFRMGDPRSTNSAGLRVFDERGSKIYDSAWKILRVVGVLRMGDRMPVPAGRKYAFIALQVRITVERSQSGGPNTQLPNIVVRRTLAEGPRNANGVLDISNGTVLGQWSRTYFPGNNTVVGWNGTFLNGLTTQYLVIDVTGF